MAVAWLSGGHEVARACSCSLLGENRFLVQSGATLPRNAPGMPWWGRVDTRLGDEDDHTPAKSRFTVERLESGAGREIEFDVAALTAVPEFRAKATVELTCPADGR